MSGRAGQPIIIEAANPDAPPRFIARPGVNTISLVNVRYLVLRYLELDGRNVPVDAVKAEGHGHYADFITLDHLYIHDHAASQQNVGISTKCPAFGWVVKGNRIERVGTGMYFGDSDGSDPFVAGLIENNSVMDTLGYNLQIKHQTARPADMPELDKQHDTLIRRNHFSKEGAFSGTYPRPNALFGHFPVSGVGQDDRYIIYNNVFFQNPNEALLQAEGNVIVFANLFVNRYGDAIHVQPHNDVPKVVTIFNNTVIAQGEGIAIRNREPPMWPQKGFANAVFSGAPVSGGQATGNLLGKYDDAARFLRAPYQAAFEMDPSPIRVMRYRDIQAWPALPFEPSGLDGNPLVPGEIGAVTSASAGRVRLPRVHP
ncbi:MAG: right-handed parallel beta-helix repeat-containing protein [Thiobacillus sp.]